MQLGVPGPLQVSRDGRVWSPGIILGCSTCTSICGRCRRRRSGRWGCGPAARPGARCRAPRAHAHSPRCPLRRLPTGGDIAEAEVERELIRAGHARVPESRTIFNNTCQDILAVAAAMLDGELEYRKGDIEQAFAHLRRSIELDDGLPCDEPWGWMQPTRHAYGALLLEQGRVEEATAVYRADLGLDDTLPRALQRPGNVWSLHGYHECLGLLGRMCDHSRSSGPGGPVRSPGAGRRAWGYGPPDASSARRSYSRTRARQERACPMPAERPPGSPPQQLIAPERALAVSVIASGRNPRSARPRGPLRCAHRRLVLAPGCPRSGRPRPRTRRRSGRPPPRRGEQ